MNSGSAKSYFWKRFLRIYPAYMAAIVIVTLAIAPLFATVSPAEFLLSSETWRALLNALHFDHEDYWVSTVIFYSTKSDYSGVLNGVLWTIQAEFLLYIIVFIMGSINALRMYAALAIAILFIIFNYMEMFIYFNIGDFYFNWWTINLAAPGFFLGSFYFFVFQRHKPSTWVAALLGILAVSSQFLDQDTLGFAPSTRTDLFVLFAAYPILWLGHDRAPNLGNWSRYGDLSYGLYLFGWPVQQVLRHVVGDGWTGWSFFLICLPVAAAIAFLSWNLIEKPAMSLRHLNVRRWPRLRAASAP